MYPNDYLTIFSGSTQYSIETIVILDKNDNQDRVYVPVKKIATNEYMLVDILTGNEQVNSGTDALSGGNNA